MCPISTWLGYAYEVRFSSSILKEPEARLGSARLDSTQHQFVQTGQAQPSQTVANQSDKESFRHFCTRRRSSLPLDAKVSAGFPVRVRTRIRHRRSLSHYQLLDPPQNRLVLIHTEFSSTAPRLASVLAILHVTETIAFAWPLSLFSVQYDSQLPSMKLFLCSA